ncbi:hypothetical protein DL95DRAFT_188254 [Leptodontidium sp. 2 PMI_412]|nr:hypothetical protein DL95DRAFT_188254 [Leptodontidium sp. 2 PMI_412]
MASTKDKNQTAAPGLSIAESTYQMLSKNLHSCNEEVDFPLYPDLNMFSHNFPFGGQNFNMDTAYAYPRTQEGYPASTGLSSSTMYAEAPQYPLESPDLRAAPSNCSTAPGSSTISTSSIGSPHSIYGYIVPVPEWAPHGLGLNPSIVQYNNYSQGNDYSYQQPTGMDDFALEFNSSNPSFIGGCKNVEYATEHMASNGGAAAADIRQPSEDSHQSILSHTSEVPIGDKEPKSPNAEIDTQASLKANLEKANPTIDRASASPLTSTIEPEEADESKENSSNAFFESTLLSLIESFKTRATVEFNRLQASADVETSSSSPSSTSHSETTSASTVTTCTTASSTTSKGKRRLVDADRRNYDDDEENDDDKKRQKLSSKSVGLYFDQRLSCPFRKHCPSKYGLSNSRYQSCATGSWKDISHLKDSHIYRVHLAQCSGCKKPMNSLAGFERHKIEATCLDLNGECNTYDGLFEREIFKVKELKFKGLGKIASWETLYKFLFPDSLPVPNPWYTSPCDSQCQSGKDDELGRMMPDEIAVFMESQFMALYNKISSNKPEILEFLMARLRKRHGGVASDAVSASTMEGTPERRPDSIEVDNGEGSSSERWDAIAPPNDTSEDDNDRDTFTDLLNFDFVGNVANSFQDYGANSYTNLNLLASSQSKDYETGWNDGHEKGYLDGQREGYKAGKKAVEEGRMSAFSRPNS